MCAINVAPNQIAWFDARPWEEPHTRPCDHDCLHLRQRVVAWGPTMDFYEIVECGHCGCRAATRATPPAGSVLSTDWIQPCS